MNRLFYISKQFKKKFDSDKAKKFYKNLNVTYLKDSRAMIFGVAFLISFLIVTVFITLSSKSKVGKLYKEITELNKDKIDSSKLKDVVYFRHYSLKEKDNLWDISRKHGLKPDTLLSVNFPKATEPTVFYYLKTGQIILIPIIDGVFEDKSQYSLQDLKSNYPNISLNEVSLTNPVSLEILKREVNLAENYFFIPKQSFSLQKLAEIMGQMFFEPIKDYRISSLFGFRIHPVYKQRKFHNGIDLAAPEGTIVYSALGGIVVEAGSAPGYGNYVLIRHKSNLLTRYAHLSSILSRTGKQVGLQEPIGRVGSTGTSTGNHLHFEVIRDGKHIDPKLLTNLRGK